MEVPEHQRRARYAQPIEAANNPHALLRLRTVCALVGLQRSSVYEKTRSGTFPKPLKLGPRCARWRAGDVMEWLRSPR